LIDAIDDMAVLYAANPELGIVRRESVRCFSVGRFIVFYAPLPDGIEIVQIIHGSRDIPEHFRRQLR
jgi:toxin ParE1/3/4